jgi:hypothetical protein
VSRRVQLRISGLHARELKAHLFPGDGNEAVAFALCGRHTGECDDVLLVQSVRPIPHARCPVRRPDRITWRTEALEPVLEEAAKRRLAVVKFHSHPTGYPAFSDTDDRSDLDLFPSIYGWIDDEGPHGSVVVLPDGRMFGRSIAVNNKFTAFDQIIIVGDSLSFFHGHEAAPDIPAHAERHAQLFGAGTTAKLRRLTIGVVGCSGTGGFVIEMLARLGVRGLVLVDPDVVEYRNLNRIVGTTSTDAALRRQKVDALAQHVTCLGLGTEVKTFPASLSSRRAVSALAACDMVFGCMDSHDGRRTLNRLSSFYLLPYFDCGVGLEADGTGGINQVCAASHYVQPGASTLLTRRVISQKRADAEAMARGDPEMYAKLRAERYIDGVEEDRPAVISVNCLAASLAVNEMLARLHRFRDDPDERFASVRFSFSQMHLDMEAESYDQPLARSLGRGDVEPLLEMPELSKSSSAAA